MSELPAFWKQKKLDDLFKEVSERNHADKNILASTQDRSVIPNDYYTGILYEKKKVCLHIN